MPILGVHFLLALLITSPVACALFVCTLDNSNSVYVASTDAGERYGGRGGALYNYGPDGTVLFKGEAMFKENVGILVRTYEQEAGCRA